VDGESFRAAASRGQQHFHPGPDFRFHILRLA
jgi:hypothetical protein